MKNRRILILLVLVIFFVAGFAVLLKPRTPSKEINGKVYPIAYNIEQAGFVDDDVFFFTGSSFSSLDLQTAKTNQLTPYFYTKGEVTASQYTGSSIIFSVNGASEEDEIGHFLKTQNINPSHISWWRFDLGTKQLQLINFAGTDSCVSMNEAGNNLYCFAPIEGSSHNYRLIEYSQKTKKTREVVKTTDPVSDIQTTGNKITYVTTNLDNSQALNTVDGDSSSILYQNKTRFNYKVAEDYVVVNDLGKVNNLGPGDDSHLNEKSKQTLSVLDLTGKKIRSINISEPIGTLNLGKTNITYSTNDSKNFYVLNKKEIKKYKWTQNGSLKTWFENGDPYYIKDGKLFANHEIQSGVLPGAAFLPAQNLDKSTFYVSEINSEKNIVYLNSSGIDFPDYAQQVDLFLKNLGYDPNQFNFDWSILNIKQDLSNKNSILVIK